MIRIRLAAQVVTAGRALAASRAPLDDKAVEHKSGGGESLADGSQTVCDDCLHLPYDWLNLCPAQFESPSL